VSVTGWLVVDEVGLAARLVEVSPPVTTVAVTVLAVEWICAASDGQPRTR
jgi:hypothetical protein